MWVTACAVALIERYTYPQPPQGMVWAQTCSDIRKIGALQPRLRLAALLNDANLWQVDGTLNTALELFSDSINAILNPPQHDFVGDFADESCENTTSDYDSVSISDGEDGDWRAKPSQARTRVNKAGNSSLSSYDIMEPDNEFSKLVHSFEVEFDAGMDIVDQPFSEDDALSQPATWQEEDACTAPIDQATNDLESLSSGSLTASEVEDIWTNREVHEAHASNTVSTVHLDSLQKNKI